MEIEGSHKLQLTNQQNFHENQYRYLAKKKRNVSEI